MEKRERPKGCAGPGPESCGASDVSPRGEELEVMTCRLQLANAAIEGAELGVVFAEADGRVLQANAPARSLLGYAKEEQLLGLPALAFVTQPELLAGILAAVDADGAWQGQVVARRRDGVEVQVEAVVKRITSCERSAARLMATLRDISKKAALAAQLERAQRISHLGHWSWHVGSGALEWSDETWRIFGLEPSDGPMTYERFLGHLPPPDQAAVRAGVERALAGGDRYAIDHRILRADGALRVVREEADLALDAAGKPVHMFGTCHDVTELRAQEAELRRSNHLRRAAIEASSVMLFALDKESRATVIEGRAFERFGVTAERLVGHRLWDVVPDMRVLPSLVPRALAGESFRIGAEYKGATLALTVGPLFDERGDIEGAVGTVVDLTAQQRLQSQLAATQRFEALAALAGGVAHDFNNLLTIIQCSTTMAKLALAPQDPAARDLEQVLAAAERASRITKELLALGRRQLVQPVALAVEPALEHLVGLARPSLGAGIQVEIAPLADLPAVHVDPVGFDQVLLNLLLNARDAMSGRGRIRIAARFARLGSDVDLELPAGDYVEISVQDTGVGMEAAVLERVFEPFFTTKAPGHGTGLGLATAFGIVRQAGGSIVVESRPGFGATFGVYLPVATSRPVQAARPAPPEGAARPDTRILIVEDDPGILAMTRRILVGAGYQVTTATNATLGLARLREARPPFDLVLADVVMPGLSGAELQRRAASEGVSTPFLLMTAHTEDAAVRFGVTAGAHVVLQKPFTPAELLARIEARLGREGGG